MADTSETPKTDPAPSLPAVATSGINSGILDMNAILDKEPTHRVPTDEDVARINASQKKDNPYNFPSFAPKVEISSVSNNILSAIPGFRQRVVRNQGAPAVHPRLKLLIHFMELPGLPTIEKIEEFNVQCAKVMKVIKDWEAYAHVSFVFTSAIAHGPRIRVKFYETGFSATDVGVLNDYVPATEENVIFGGIGGQDEVPTDNEKHLILHEFGHVLGLLHEHQSPAGLDVWTADDGGVSQQYPTWLRWEREAQITRRDVRETTISFSRIDLDSVMTYPLTLAMSVEGIPMSKNYKLSKWDKAYMVIHFPRIGNPTEDLRADGTIDIRWTIEAALDIVGVVGGDGDVGNPAGFTPLVAKYQPPPVDPQANPPVMPPPVNLDPAEEEDDTACARVRILYLYEKLREAVEALAGPGTPAAKTEAYLKSSARITTSIRNIFGKWTHRNFLATTDEQRAPVHSNELQLPVVPAAEAPANA